MPVLRRLAGPLTSGLTYRRYVHLLHGAVLLLPYVALVWLFATSVTAGGLDPLALVLLLVPATAGAVAVALVPGVRALEVTAARTLLDADVPDPDPVTAGSWPGRRRGAWWLLLNMALGGLAALLTLVVVPAAVGFLLAPWRDVAPLPTGVAAAWAPVAGLTCPLVLLYAVAAAGQWLAGLAPRLLGPTAEERLAAELAEARRSAGELAERNRLARELDDSVGHALPVTTLQAGAAARVPDADPEFARRALDAIAEAGRTALAELDHVLVLLRDPASDAAAPGDPGRAPQPDLADLDGLLDGARSAGVTVDAELRGDVAALPAVVSREAYRIVQEALTNALRHAGPVPVAVRVTVGDDDVALSVTNPLGRTAGRRHAGRSRGLTGMAERVRVLRGELATGPAEGGWRVAARLPVAAGPAAR